MNEARDRKPPRTMQHEAAFERVLSQRATPVVIRPRSGPIKVRFRYSPNNFWLLRGNNHRKPAWDGSFWICPRAWFNETTLRLLKHFGRVYVIQHFNELETCAPACWNARGIECECSCAGAHHGDGSPEGNWYVVDDVFAFRSQGDTRSCKLLVSTGAGT